MKKLSYLIVLVLILGLALTGCSLLSNVGQVPTTEQSGISYLTKATEGDPFVTTLFAGQDIDVGTVSVWNDGDYLYVEYVVDAEYWCLTETHLHVAISPENIPQKKGNPIPGKFDYKSEHDCVTNYTYEIPLTWDPDTQLSIAAHAVVCQRAGNFIAGLNFPDTVTFSVIDHYCGGPAYFPHVYINGLSIGELDVYGWCVDTDNTIGSNKLYTANIYSSYETLPDGLIEYPENLDLVNWILNQGFVGQPSACGGPYTYSDVQLAIWTLIEDNLSTIGLCAWSQCRVNEILAAADANGEGFEPGCGDIICVILESVDGEQVIIGEVVIECGCETAWGDGEDFPGKNWATYFTYVVPLHQIEVFAVSSTPVEINLDSGSYKFVVSGTDFAGGKYTEDIEFDAKYSITHSKSGDTWTDTVSGYESHGKDLLDLQVNGISLEWGIYNVDHIYGCSWTGGGEVEFCIKDIFYPNNTGYLTVEIYK